MVPLDVVTGRNYMVSQSGYIPCLAFFRFPKWVLARRVKSCVSKFYGFVNLLIILAGLWSDFKGSSTSWSCSNWRLWEKDMFALVCIKWFLWSFRVVHNGGQDYFSFLLLQTGRAFAITSMPVSNRVECQGTSHTAFRWRTVLQSSKLLLVQYFSGNYIILVVLLFLAVCLFSLFFASFL